MDKIDNSNPNPDDPNNGKGTSKPDIEALIKNAKGASWTVKVNPEDSPMGGVITDNGGGKAPHWNPGEDDSGKGPSNPPDSKGPKGSLTPEQIANIQKQLNAAARQAALGEQGMFDGSEGGSENAPGINLHNGIKQDQNNGKGNGDEDGDGKNDYIDKYLPKGEALGPQPEVVNPSPELKCHTAAKKHLGTITLKNKTSGKGTGGKTDTHQMSNVLSPGLLEGGNSFSYNGPTGAGSAIGAVHSGPALRSTH